MQFASSISLNNTSPDSQCFPAIVYLFFESILNGLSALGIPVQADKEGALFSRPSVRPLLGLVQLCARPHHRHHASWVARSVLVGLNDDELDTFIRNSPKDSNLIERMVDFAHTEQQSSLIQGWCNRVNSGRIIELLDWTIDHSDLLLAYPMDSDRIDAENFVDFIRNTLQESGGDIVLLADRLARIERDGDGAAAKDMSSAGGVRIMTIHKSKGLAFNVVMIPFNWEGGKNYSEIWVDAASQTNGVLKSTLKIWQEKTILIFTVLTHPTMF